MDASAGVSGCRRRAQGVAGGGCISAGAFTCRWRLLLSSRAWNEPGVSMVCCRERAACGALMELCRNHGSDIFRLLLCCFWAAPAPAGGGVVPMAPARAAARSRGPHRPTRRAALSPLPPRAAPAAAAARSLRPLTTQPPYRATLPEFIPRRDPPQRRAKDAPNPFV